MNLQTLERLERNPHYTLSTKQRAELERLRQKENREPMVEFGVPSIHNSNVNIHDVKVVKKKRTSKKN